MLVPAAFPQVPPIPVTTTRIHDDVHGRRKALSSGISKFCRQQVEQAIHTDTTNKLDLNPLMNHLFSITYM